MTKLTQKSQLTSATSWAHSGIVKLVGTSAHILLLLFIWLMFGESFTTQALTNLTCAAHAVLHAIANGDVA